MSNTARQPVVLVPGYQDNRKKMVPLAAYLSARGFDPLPLSPQPSNGSVGIDELANKLAEQIDAALGPDQPFNLFGFSMGGLIGRYYLQRLGGVRRVTRFVTLATPHLGSWSAKWIRSQQAPAIVQMRPGSAFLQELNDDLATLDQVSFTAMWTPFDLSVTPYHHAYLPDRPTQRVLSPFHGLLVYDLSVQRTVERMLRMPLHESAVQK